MFPDIPVYVSFVSESDHGTNTFSYRDNIRYDLLRTGNVELTTNKVLERGILEAVYAVQTTIRISSLTTLCFPFNLATRSILHSLSP